ncbi:hypothetical protein [Kineococcus sp. SYSU DK001]|uniref:hypothetical protein n=1 Tax=Kineococcus sp. SYSU DK001 TaxID=3383122 RepID=UPI003D7E1CA1
MTSAVPSSSGDWDVRVQPLAPARPRLRPLRVPDPPEPLVDADVPGDDPVSAVIGVVLLALNLPWFLLIVLVWVPLWTAKFCWFLLRLTITVAVVTGGLLGWLLLPLPWEVVAVRTRPVPDVRITRTAGWPAALVQRHRLARGRGTG